MQRDKTRAKRIKTRAKRQKERQTRNKPLIRLTIHAYKATQSTQTTKTTQTHTTTPKPAKTALKTQIKAYSQAMQREQSVKADKKAGTRHQRTSAGIQVSHEVPKAGTPTPADTMEHHHERHTRHHTHTPLFKYIFAFYALLSPKFPRRHQSEQIKSNFCHVSPCSGRKYATMERGTHHQRRTTPEAGTPATSGHHHRHKERATTEAPAILKNQIYLRFCPFRSPKFPRKHQSTPKKNSLLTCFVLFG